MRTDDLSRRRLLASGLAGIALGLSGCLDSVPNIGENDADSTDGQGSQDKQDGRDEQEEQDEQEIPVVDNGNSDRDWNVVIDVHVVDGDGAPIPDTEVRLEDRGGSADNRLGQTGSSGRLRFIESVGPSPCNTLTLVIPEAGLESELGCHNGNTELSEQFVLEQ